MRNWICQMMYEASRPMKNKANGKECYDAFSDPSCGNP